MKSFKKLKAAVSGVLIGLGILINIPASYGQIIVSTAYEQEMTPLKPENLNAAPLYYSLIRLTWSDQSNNENGFHIYMRDKYRNQYRVLFDVPANRTYAYIWDLEALTEYHFYVVAYNKYGGSEASNIATATTPDYYIHGTPAAPTNLEIISQGQNEVEIGWQDNSRDELGFMIARKLENDLYYEIIDSVETDVLTYREVGLEPDRIYLYKVCAYNEYGFSAYTNVVILNTGNDIIIREQSADEYYLKANYPNPFNPSTVIEFGLPQASNVKLSIYNLLGEEISVLTNSFMQPGNYAFEWDATAFSSGVYFYRFQAGSYTQIRKMLLIK